MKHVRVAVLRGGPSSEHRVSMETGANVISALRSADFYVKDVVIALNGEWLIDGVVKSPEKVMIDIDVAFIALHGEYGEDGSLQRVLERLRVPYTGSGPLPSSVAMNKTLTKTKLKPHGIKMPKHMRLTREGITDIPRTAQSIAALFGPQFFVKPERGGSSISTYLVKSEVELPQAISKAFEASDEILVEERIIGKEATVGILENFRNEAYYLLPPVEIVPPESAGFFAAEVKYTGETLERCPGNFTRQEKDELMHTARNVHALLDLKHYSRSDFIVAADGVYFLEVNTLPGLTAQSLFPKAVDAVGCSYGELVTHLVTLAHQTRR